MEEDLKGHSTRSGGRWTMLRMMNKMMTVAPPRVGHADPCLLKQPPPLNNEGSLIIHVDEKNIDVIGSPIPHSPQQEEPSPWAPAGGAFTLGPSRRSITLGPSRRSITLGPCRLQYSWNGKRFSHSVSLTAVGMCCCC